MPKRTGASQLNRRVSFAKRGDLVDSYGNITPGAGPWTEQFTIAARLQPKFGTNVESFAASRLASKQPYNLTVRACAATKAVRTDWQVVDARQTEDANGASPRVFNIVSIVDPDERGQFLEMLVIEGESS